MVLDVSDKTDIYMMKYMLHFCSMSNHCPLITIERPIFSSNMNEILNVSS